jgi:hypothetical protein
MSDVNSLDLETVRFLYDKRLTLFNVRREHEWKVIFGVLILLGAVDATLLTKPVCLSSNVRIFWQAGIIILCTATLFYEWGIQARNRVDRKVMDRLQQILCDYGGIPPKSGIRICVDCEAERRMGELQPDRLVHLTYIWALLSQAAVLILSCVLSFLVPGIACNLL